jgi:hypothetical protein
MHVANAVLWTIDHCTRPDQSCAGKLHLVRLRGPILTLYFAGFQAAYGNGDLVIGATNIIW